MITKHLVGRGSPVSSRRSSRSASATSIDGSGVSTKLRPGPRCWVGGARTIRQPKPKYDSGGNAVGNRDEYLVLDLDTARQWPGRFS
jgi:hypothetical protein